MYVPPLRPKRDGTHSPYTGRGLPPTLLQFPRYGAFHEVWCISRTGWECCLRVGEHSDEYDLLLLLQLTHLSTRDISLPKGDRPINVCEALCDPRMTSTVNHKFKQEGPLLFSHQLQQQLKPNALEILPHSIHLMGRPESVCLPTVRFLYKSSYLLSQCKVVTVHVRKSQSGPL